MTRDEVIKSLETAVKNFERYSGDEYGREYDYAMVGVDVLEDTIALLKVQEPRVMTVEEVKAFEWDYCYLEQERQPGKEYRMIMGDYALTCITWPCITSMRTEYGDSSYGVKWRCWTSRPDEKTRETTPWDAQEQREYEAAVEMAEHCERYEPTYNADDGSM